MRRLLRKTLMVLVVLLAIVFIALLLLSNPDMPLNELKDKYTDGQSQFMEIEGMQVHYKDEGEGYPLLLLHGTASSLHTWDGWTEELKDSFRIIRMDLPAFGITGPNANNDYSLEAYNEFLNKFMDKLKVDSFYLAGNSLGGLIAWNYALAAPNRVTKLILVDPAGYWDEERKMILGLRIARIPVVRTILKHVTPRFMVEKSIRQCYGDTSKVEGWLIDRYHHLLLREGNRAAYVARMNEPYEYNSPRIGTIPQPTLILWGELDQLIPVRDAYKFEEDIENAELIVYDGIGHIPMEEIPEQTAQDALGFLLQME